MMNLSSKTGTTSSSASAGDTRTITCYTCGMPSSKEWAQKVRCRPSTPNRPYFPTLLQIIPPHGACLREDGSTYLCAFCHASLDSQWSEYERQQVNLVPPGNRKYSVQQFVCSVCSVQTYRKRVRALPFQEFPFLVKQKQPGSLTLGNNPLAVVCLDCSETLWAQSAEYDRWGLPVHKRHFNWMARPPPPEDSVEATVARLPSGETQLPRCPPTEPKFSLPISQNLESIQSYKPKMKNIKNDIQPTGSTGLGVGGILNETGGRKLSITSASTPIIETMSAAHSQPPVVTVAPMSSHNTLTNMRKETLSVPPDLNLAYPKYDAIPSPCGVQPPHGPPPLFSRSPMYTPTSYSPFPWAGREGSMSEHYSYPNAMESLQGTPTSSWSWLPPPSSDLLRYQSFMSSFQNRGFNVGDQYFNSSQSLYSGNSPSNLVAVASVDSPTSSYMSPYQIQTTISSSSQRYSSPPVSVSSGNLSTCHQDSSSSYITSSTVALQTTEPEVVGSSHKAGRISFDNKITKSAIEQAAPTKKSGISKFQGYGGKVASDSHHQKKPSSPKKSSGKSDVTVTSSHNSSIAIGGKDWSHSCTDGGQSYKFNEKIVSTGSSRTIPYTKNDCTPSSISSFPGNERSNNINSTTNAIQNSNNKHELLVPKKWQWQVTNSGNASGKSNESSCPNTISGENKSQQEIGTYGDTEPMDCSFSASNNCKSSNVCNSSASEAKDLSKSARRNVDDDSNNPDSRSFETESDCAIDLSVTAKASQQPHPLVVPPSSGSSSSSKFMIAYLCKSESISPPSCSSAETTGGGTDDNIIRPDQSESSCQQTESTSGRSSVIVTVPKIDTESYSSTIPVQDTELNLSLSVSNTTNAIGSYDPKPPTEQFWEEPVQNLSTRCGEEKSFVISDQSVSSVAGISNNHFELSNNTGASVAEVAMSPKPEERVLISNHEFSAVVTESSKISENNVDDTVVTNIIDPEQFIRQVMEEFVSKEKHEKRVKQKACMQQTRFLNELGLITPKKKTELELNILISRSERKTLPPIKLRPEDPPKVHLSEEFKRQLLQVAFDDPSLKQYVSDPTKATFMGQLGLKVASKNEKSRREAEWRIVLTERMMREKRNIRLRGTKRPWDSYSSVSKLLTPVTKLTQDDSCSNPSVLKSLSLTMPPDSITNTRSCVTGSSDLLTTVENHQNQQGPAEDSVGESNVNYKTSTSVIIKNGMSIVYPKYIPSYELTSRVSAEENLGGHQSSDILNVPSVVFPETETANYNSLDISKENNDFLLHVKKQDSENRPLQHILNFPSGSILKVPVINSTTVRTGQHLLLPSTDESDEISSVDDNEDILDNPTLTGNTLVNAKIGDIITPLPQKQPSNWSRLNTVEKSYATCWKKMQEEIQALMNVTTRVNKTDKVTLQEAADNIKILRKHLKSQQSEIKQTERMVKIKEKQIVKQLRALSKYSK